MFPKDLQEFLRLLTTRKIEFLVIGGVAYNVHAPPRATKDLDVWARPELEILERLLAAIREFGFPTEGVDARELTETHKVLMLGRVPQRIDVLTQPAGVQWSQAWPRRLTVHYGDVEVGVLSLEDLILAKRAAARPRDPADVSVLERVARRTKPTGQP